MQVNVQFLQQLQPEWSRFVTVVKQRQEIDTVSYHKLFDVLKQHKGKEIAKPVTPQSESVSRLSDLEQARRIKDMKKDLATPANTIRSYTNLPTTTFMNNYTKGISTRTQSVRHLGIKDEDKIWTLPGNTGSQSGLKTMHTTRKKMMMCKQAEQGIVITLPHMAKRFRRFSPEDSSSTVSATGSGSEEATSSRDSSLIALQTKQTELEKYTALNDRTSDYKILQTKLNETLGLLALKDIEIKEGLKTKTYEISVVNQKHDELVKKSLLNRSQFEGQLKEKSKVILDLKVKEGIYLTR
ncbi:hypothetical protein Tco_0388587 [Tanacetum coccineum]